MHILSAIPLWVFPLLVALIAIGLRASRDRSAPVWLYYALPALALLSLFRALSLGPVAVGTLAMAWLAGTALGHALQPRWTVARSGPRIELRGEWLTMGTVLSLFIANFTAGMALGMAPTLAHGSVFGLFYGLFCGMLSGTLMGRTLSILRA